MPGMAIRRLVPHGGVDHEGQVCRAERAKEPVEPSDMVGVSAAEHDELNVGRREAQAPHVVDKPVWGHPGVEEQVMISPAAG